MPPIGSCAIMAILGVVKIQVRRCWCGAEDNRPTSYYHGLRKLGSLRLISIYQGKTDSISGRRASRQAHLWGGNYL